jgi:hypothetical protein
MDGKKSGSRSRGMGIGIPHTFIVEGSETGKSSRAQLMSISIIYNYSTTIAHRTAKPTGDHTADRDDGSLAELKRVVTPVNTHDAIRALMMQMYSARNAVNTTLISPVTTHSITENFRHFKAMNIVVFRLFAAWRQRDRRLYSGRC